MTTTLHTTGSETESETTTDDPTRQISNKLREAFDDNRIHQLPRIICNACRNSPKKECHNHKKQKCRDCGNWITQAHMHLDYVGHAETTERLLEVDPLWTWEPMAFDERGLPAFDMHGGLWIRLTVAGHTRIGYGDSQEKTGPNAVKEVIGDAIRNAAMRFGVALNLWAKSNLHESETEHPKTQEEDEEAQQQADLARNQEIAARQNLHHAREKLATTGTKKGLTPDDVAQWCLTQYNFHPKDANQSQILKAEAELAKLPDVPVHDDTRAA